MSDIKLVSSIPIAPQPHAQRNSDRVRQITRLALSTAAAFGVAFAVITSSNQPVSLTETFADGPDPDAPGGKFLSGGVQAQTLQGPASGMNAIPDTESGFTVDRLERVMKKIHSAESAYEGIELKRQNVMKRITRLNEQMNGLTTEANDEKADLVRYTEDQRALVAQLQPPGAEEGAPAEDGADGEAAPSGDQPAAGETAV